MSSATSRRTAGPNRRRTSSRSRACSRSSSRSSSTSKSALRVTRNRVVLDDLHAGEQHRQVGGDQVLERQVLRLVRGLRDDHEARHVVGHLDPGEALDLAVGVAHQHGEVERQPGDVGERVRRVDRQRRQHREDLAAEVVGQPRRSSSSRASQRTDVDALARPAPARCPRGSSGRAGRPVRGCARRAGPASRAAIRPSARGDLQAHVGAALQPGDAHHVELVEVAGEDGEELHPLEQRLAVGPRPGRAPAR